MFAARTKWNLAPNRWSLALEKFRASAREYLDLTISNPTQAGFTYDQQAILQALQDSRSLTYHPEPLGLRSARQAVADYYQQRLQLNASAAELDVQRILLTASTSEAYSYLFHLLCNPGDEVLTPAPSYPLFQYLADLEDVRLVHYPLFYDHGWHVDLHALEEAVTTRTRAIVVVHPNNPTGSYVHQKEASELNRICASHGLALLADEVFLDYDLCEGRADSFVTNRSALTFTLSGLSKLCALPQMKLAWIVTSGPDALAQSALQRIEVIADTYLSLSTPVQCAAALLLEQRRTMQPQLLHRVQQNLQELDRQLAMQTACSRLQVEGGWYAVLRVPAVVSDEEMAIHLLEQCSVLTHPGHFFDFARDGYLILSLITPAAVFTEGIRRILTDIAS